MASAALVLHALAQEEGSTDKVFIVSDNLVHLAIKDMAAIGILVVLPGEFINMLNVAAPTRVEKALLKTIEDLEAPPFTREDLLRLLDARGAIDTAKFYASKWNMKIPQQGVAVGANAPLDGDGTSGSVRDKGPLKAPCCLD